MNRQATQSRSALASLKVAFWSVARAATVPGFPMARVAFSDYSFIGSAAWLYNQILLFYPLGAFSRCPLTLEWAQVEPTFTVKEPLDDFPYAREPGSVPFAADLEPGDYVFVQDITGTVYVVPEAGAGHLHPKVIGNGSAAIAAGGVRIGEGGVVLEIDNFSGTFPFGPEILLQVKLALQRQGGNVENAKFNPFEH